VIPLEDPLHELQKKLDKAKRKADYNRIEYWKLRIKVIVFLGGKCECGETYIKNLEIHHDPPTLKGGYKNVNGWDIMKEWKGILSGKVSAKLYCRECHLKYGHGGSTYNLRNLK
jgi:hypothetical protein